MLFQLLYHKFLSQTTDPSLSKAMKVARLQLACKPGSSSSQRVLPRLSVAECFEFMQLRPFFSSPVSHFRHFPFLHTSFLVLPVPFQFSMMTRCNNRPTCMQMTKANVHGTFIAHGLYYASVGGAPEAYDDTIR